MIVRIVLAILVGVVIGLIVVALLGPLLVLTHVAPLVLIGHFCESYGWAFGVLAGIWYFLRGSPTLF